MTDNIYWHASKIDNTSRQKRYKHKSFVLWFTGLSGSGKSTLANAVEKNLFDLGHNVIVLDGDNIRHGLCSDLGFTRSDRNENMRRIGEVSKLFIESGIIVLAAFISPYRSDREQIRSKLPHGDFCEVFCKRDLIECEKHDPKGLYKKARTGEIKNFSGISAPYEEPINPEITVNSNKLSVDDAVLHIMEQLQQQKLIKESS